MDEYGLLPEPAPVDEDAVTPEFAAPEFPPIDSLEDDS